MSTLVAEIKQQLNILELAKDHVLHLKPTKPEGWYIGHCPFHQSATDPRSKRKFWIDARPGRGLCSCFVPRCAAQNPGHRPMDVINFYARLHKLPNRYAIFELAERLNLVEEVAE